MAKWKKEKEILTKMKKASPITLDSKQCLALRSRVLEVGRRAEGRRGKEEGRTKP